MVIGYCRVSSLGQEEKPQIEKLQSVGCEKIFVDKDSGMNPNRENFNRMKDMLRSGDKLVVLELSRVGRDLLFVLDFIKYLQTNNINFVSLRENIDISTASGVLILHIFSSIAEFERKRLLERQKLGIMYAKEHNVKFGRPQIESKIINQALTLYKSGISCKEILEITGISKATLYRYIKKLNISKI